MARYEHLPDGSIDIIADGPFDLPSDYYPRDIVMAAANLASVGWDERDTLHTPRVCVGAVQLYRRVMFRDTWGNWYKSDPRRFSSLPKKRRVSL